MAKYVCTVCGYVYDEEIGDPDNGIEAGTSWDELDEEVQQFTMVDDNNFVVMTNVLVEEFWEYFELDEEIETDATTINGLITEIADCIPEIGYEFELENLSITVTKANDFMTEEIAVRVNPKSEEETEE